MALLDNAQKDTLTQCYTKDALVPLLEKMISEYMAYKKPFSILLIDIDGFKKLNDRYGHVFGDEALKYFSSSLRLNLDDEDCAIIRFGGDEFVAVFPGRPAKEVYRLANHTEHNIRTRPFLFKSREFKFSFSGGIASCPGDTCDLDDMLEMADKAMYFSKHRGGGKITIYAKIRSEFLKRFMKTLIVLAVIAFIVYIAQDVVRIDLSGIRDKLISIKKAVAPIMKPPSKIFLKSGNSIEGIITNESDREMSIKVNVPGGEGTVLIKKSEIAYVERGYKK
ncbi:MAG: GGDEF domain-containing protein [Candidatus Omnitrophota bacterium]